MVIARCLIAAALLIGMAPAAHAEDAGSCLDPQQRRDAIAARRAIPLSRVVRTVKAHHAGDIVRARLCERGDTLVYLLTLLSHDGKVTHAAIDGVSGAVLHWQ